LPGLSSPGLLTRGDEPACQDANIRIFMLFEKIAEERRPQGTRKLMGLSFRA
jgi:hypothetical protein